MKIGILGGTFDPIHIAHLILAEQAREQLNLDIVKFVPAGDPWRKANRHISAAADRLEMTRLAVAGSDFFEVDDREVLREGATFTVDTLREFRSEMEEGDELYFLTGEDALADITNWRDPSGIAEAAYIVVAPREGVPPHVDAVPEDRLVRLEMPNVGISSTLMRQLAARGASLKYMVPEAVAVYIKDKGLYSESSK